MATACADALHRSNLNLYSVAQLRDIERAALASVPPFTLMQRAGRATAELALQLLHAASPLPRVLVLAGPGNNGGDALEAAATLAGQGIHVEVVLAADPAAYVGDAAQAYQRAADSAANFTHVEHFARVPHATYHLAIDGLFGIGLTRAPEGTLRHAIHLLNKLPCPVLAIDVPSGLHADSGALIGNVAVRASHTISFIGNKPGLHTAQGRDHAGDVHVETLQIDVALYGPPLAVLNHPALFNAFAKQRPHASHKGSYGDLTVIGGAAGMGGAVLLAARMGAMAGAGRVFAAFADKVPAFDPVHPELMCRAAHAVALEQGAVVAGPGLGLSRDAHELLSRALASHLPLVIDADGLNLLAEESPLQHKLAARAAPCILTPHPLEAARLSGTDAAQVQSNRIAAATDIARRYRSVVILKGSGSVIAAADGRVVINGTGNPALATAGSGDVLAGLCGALLAQHWPAWEAALAATWLHGTAADDLVAAGTGPVGVTAGELLPQIRAAFNHLITRAGSSP
jgi:hydroxyethylthiazole kinase-like uncharacterized protein yjeF